MRRRFATRILRSEQRLEDRYVLAGLLIVACILVFAFAGDGHFARVVSVALESITLIVILRASQVPPRRVRIAGLVCAGGVVAVVASTTANGTFAKAAPLIISAVLALGGPIAIINRLVRQPMINFTTVAGALCIYLLAGLFFALVYWSNGALHDGRFFVQTNTPTGVDFVYFSFVTLTTTGYGDLTAQADAGRMCAILEALFGQLYLVSIVALLVANMGRGRVVRGAGVAVADPLVEPTIQGTP